MNKKLPLLLIFAFLLFVPMVSAIGITYEKNDLGVNDMRVKVSDTTLFGLIKTTEIGSFELKSHKTPTEIIDVSPGWDVTMKYELNFNELISYGLGDVYFIDLRTGKEVEREYKFVYWGTEERSKEVCIEEAQVKSLNSTNVTSECIKYGTETYTYEGWLDYTSKDIPKGKITLGLMVNNKVNDYIDGVWEVAGKKLTKHAGWTASLDNGLVSWYSLDETSGTTAFDSLGRNNGTNNGATINQTGKVNRSYSFDGSNDEVITNSFLINSNSFTISFWGYFDEVKNQYAILKGNTADAGGFFFRSTGDISFWCLSKSITTNINTYSTGLWNHYVGVYNGTHNIIYINGVNTNSTSNSGTINANSTLKIGSAGGDLFTNGKIDEVGIWNRTLTTDEIALLYNNGDGLGYQQIFEAVTSLSPIDNFNSSSKDITFIGNTTQESVTNFSLIIDDVYEQTNTSGLSGNYTFTETLDDGVYSWKFESCNADTCINSTARTLTVDSLAPEINITSPVTNYNYLYPNVTLDLNWSVEDEAGHLDSVWYGYTGKTFSGLLTTGSKYTVNNFTITDAIGFNVYYLGGYSFISNDICSSKDSVMFGKVGGVGDQKEYFKCYNDTTTNLGNFTDVLYIEAIKNISGMTTTTFNYAPNVNNITVYANDTFGNFGSLRQNWDVKTLEQNRIYNLNTIEGSYESYQLNLTKLSTVQISGAVLHLDGQTQDSQVFVSGNNVRIVNELLINPVESSTNLTLFWTITLSDSSVFNTTTSSQLVENVGIDNCSVNTFPLITFLLKDEELLTPLNGTIESKIEIVNPFSFGVVSTLSSQYTNVNSKSFCTSLNLTNSGFLLNSEIRYSSENHSAEFYNIQRANLSSFPTNVTLYDLKIEDTTKFKIIYQNDKLIGVPGAIIQLQRGYLSEDVFYVVEAPLTSSESTAIVHIDTNTNKYKITVVKDGVVLGTFDNLAFICQSELTGECTLSLFDTLQAPNIIPIETIIDFAYTIDTNSVNRTVEVDFTIPSGTPSPVQVLITQKTIVGTETICNQTIITSAGSVLCEYNQSISDSELTLKIIKGDTLISQTGYVVTDDILGEFGGNNFFLVVLMLLSLTFMAISSPEWIIVNTLITLLVAGAMWLINGMNLVAGLGLIAFLVIAGVILIIKISKQEDL